MCNNTIKKLYLMFSFLGAINIYASYETQKNFIIPAAAWTLGAYGLPTLASFAKTPCYATFLPATFAGGLVCAGLHYGKEYLSESAYKIAQTPAGTYALLCAGSFLLDTAYEQLISKPQPSKEKFSWPASSALRALVQPALGLAALHIANKMRS